MSALIIFTTGYLLGGLTALVVLGITLAARRGDSGFTSYAAAPAPQEETVAAWRHKG
jgi:hypothetical protein